MQAAATAAKRAAPNNPTRRYAIQYCICLMIFLGRVPVVHVYRPFSYIYTHPRPSGNVLSRTRTHPSGVCAGAVRLRCCLRPGSQLEKSRVEARGGHLAVGARAPQWPPPARWPHGEGQRRTRWVLARSYSPGGPGRVYPSQLGQLVDIIVVIWFFSSPRSSDCSRRGTADRS